MSGKWGIKGGAAAALLGLSLMTAYAQSDPSSAPLAQNVNVTVDIPSAIHPVVASEVFDGTVQRVIDDRTLVVHRDDKDRDETVQLFGIQTPPAGASDGKQSAHDYLTKGIKNSKVRVEGRGRDRQGVLAALVTPVSAPQPGVLLPAPDVTGISSGIRNDHPEGRDELKTQQPEKSLNETLVRLGLARYDARQAPNETELAAAESDARKEHKGFWSAQTATGTVSSAEKP